MAHFSKLDENNIVIQVSVVDNEYAPDEATGLAFLKSIGHEGKWVQTSYNTYAGEHKLGGVPFRGNYGAVGWTYDEKLDAFVAPKHPDPEYTQLNLTTFMWEKPTS